MIEMIIYGTVKSEPKKLKAKSDNVGFLISSSGKSQDVYVFAPEKLVPRNVHIGSPVMIIGRFIDIWHMKKDKFALTIGAHKIVDMLKILSQTPGVISNKIERR